MLELKKIVTLNNMVEANLLEQVLKEKNIPYMIRSFHDTAYDGIFQVQYGWGVIEAPEKYRDEIMIIYEEISKENKTINESDWKNPNSENYPGKLMEKNDSTIKNWIFNSILLLSILIIIFLLFYNLLITNHNNKYGRHESAAKNLVAVSGADPF